MVPVERPGVTSRIRPARGRRQRWQATPDATFLLPVIVDHMYVDAETGVVGWHFEVTIDLVDDEPQIVRMDLRAPGGMDVVRMQREFRWASPLDVVTRSIPVLLERGIDPFDFELPVQGFPESAGLGKAPNHPLSDAFLEDIAREYLTLGRGYARTIARERQVSPRTVVSWVEKARRRGILTRVPAGSFGGDIVPKSKRPRL